jgi:hypothetical protein
MMQIPIQVDQHGQSLLGMLHIPSRRAKGSPVVMINYGLNGDRVDNHRLALSFAEKANQAGITVIRFDYLGCGLSSGEFHDTSIVSKTADTLRMIEFIKGCFQGEAYKLILLGYSDGIRVIHNILKNGVNIYAIVAWNPIVRSMTQTFKAAKNKKPTIEPTTKKLVFPLFGLYMGIDYLKQANEHISIDTLLNKNLPKLFIFGSEDSHTREFRLEMQASQHQYPDLHLLEVAGANHLFNKTEWSEHLIDHTVDWVAHICN